jgi:hypothetical protein
VLTIVDRQPWWRSRVRGTAFLTARPAGSIRPDGKRIVSLKHAGRMRTMGADRVVFALTHGRWPQGRVVEDGDQLLDLPRRARSPGRRGGLVAERARDVRALTAIAAGATTVTALATATGSAKPNARRRMTKLATQGLLITPQCVPGRAHFWLLSAAGMEAVEEAELCERVVPTNGHSVPWIDRAAISAAPHLVGEIDVEVEKPRPPGPRRGLTDRRLSRATHRLGDGGFIGA